MHMHMHMCMHMLLLLLLQVLSEPSLDVRLLALLSRLLARRCARGDEHAAAACAWRPKLLHAAWPGLRSFAQEVRWDWATPSLYICVQPLLHIVAAICNTVRCTCTCTHMHMLHMHMPVSYTHLTLPTILLV